MIFLIQHYSHADLTFSVVRNPFYHPGLSFAPWKHLFDHMDLTFSLLNHSFHHPGLTVHLLKHLTGHPCQPFYLLSESDPSRHHYPVFRPPSYLLMHPSPHHAPCASVYSVLPCWEASDGRPQLLLTFHAHPELSLVSWTVVRATEAPVSQQVMGTVTVPECVSAT